MARLEAPLDRVRLHQIDLDADTETEEQFIHLRETLCYLLAILAHWQIILIKSSLVKCLNFFNDNQGTDGQRLTQLYQVYLTVFEIY
jgi:hypothetical protein